MKLFARIACGTLLVIGLVLGLAMLLPQRESIYDFIMLYAANLGVINRIPLYDNAALTAMAITKISPGPNFSLFPYPYPPWYALSTFYLGFLPVYRAVTAWMLLNIAMLAASVLLLTAGWKPLYRVLAIVAALMFIPALGLIVVGQYSAPVLLGACLFSYATKRQDAALTALGLLLLTFKPHIGILLFLTGFLWLVFQKNSFTWQAVWLTLGGGLILVALGFVADPAWPLTYSQALLGYRALPGVSSCELCASLSVLLVKIFTGHSDTLQAAWVSLALAAGLGVGLLWWKPAFLWRNPATLITLCALITLLVDPYLLNYDYILLLIPLTLLAEKRRALWLACAYLLPWGTLIFGREANFLITLAGILMLILLLVPAPVDSIPNKPATLPVNQ